MHTKLQRITRYNEFAKAVAHHTHAVFLRGVWCVRCACFLRARDALLCFVARADVLINQWFVLFTAGHVGNSGGHETRWVCFWKFLRGRRGVRPVCAVCIFSAVLLFGMSPCVSSEGKKSGFPHHCAGLCFCSIDEKRNTHEKLEKKRTRRAENFCFFLEGNSPLSRQVQAVIVIVSISPNFFRLVFGVFSCSRTRFMSVRVVTDVFFVVCKTAVVKLLDESPCRTLGPCGRLPDHGFAPCLFQRPKKKTCEHDYFLFIFCCCRKS